MKGIAYWELFAEEKLADFMISDKNKTTNFFLWQMVILIKNSSVFIINYSYIIKPLNKSIHKYFTMYMVYLLKHYGYVILILFLYRRTPKPRNNRAHSLVRSVFIVWLLYFNAYVVIPVVEITATHCS